MQQGSGYCTNTSDFFPSSHHFFPSSKNFFLSSYSAMPKERHPLHAEDSCGTKGGKKIPFSSVEFHSLSFASRKRKIKLRFLLLSYALPPSRLGKETISTAYYPFRSLLRRFSARLIVSLTEGFKYLRSGEKIKLRFPLFSARLIVSLTGGFRYLRSGEKIKLRFLLFSARLIVSLPQETISLPQKGMFSPTCR